MTKQIAILITVCFYSMSTVGVEAKNNRPADPQDLLVEPNMVIIKFKPAGFLKKDMQTTGNESLDRVLKANGISSMRRVFNEQDFGRSCQAGSDRLDGSHLLCRL